VDTVTVALPVLNGEAHLDETLRAVRRQRAPGPVELLVADSGSKDRSVEIALGYGARIIEVAPKEFSHGGTRNLLMQEADGSKVAFLTQDAVPATEDWLTRLLAGFELADDVALVYGPYLPRPEASHMVRRELEEFFGQTRRIDRFEGELRPGPVTFFTDANGCVSREAWEKVPFRPVGYAEDQLLAQDMLRAGYAKVYEPDAAVVHSHDYGAVDRFRRFFDEFRGLREVYGHVEEAGARHTLGTIRNQVAADRRWLRNHGVAGRELDRATLQSLRFFGLRAAGSIAGSRADRIPSPLRGLCSLERRKTFEPVD
jgi:glycosyltransferase involved in cell wall biosynthesis